ncbi:MAG: hypothetical protein GX115_11475 [Ruminiclostridium sp.]|nr:hypothetical protein [Ruminiclostridium sp.]
MNLLFGLLLLCIHLLICIYYGIRIGRKPSSLPRYLLAVICFVPVFGFSSALIVEYLYKHKKTGTKTLPLGEFYANQTNLNPIPILDKEDVSSLVPMEEALILNDSRSSRSLMMEVVKDPSCYKDLLRVARLSHDPEITHFASTAIMKMQHTFELEIQSCRTACLDNPENESILDQYIKAIYSYIKSGFTEGILLENLRERLDQLLDKKIGFRLDDRQSYFQKLDNCIECARFTDAWEVVNHMQDKWPADQNVWLQTIRVCVNSKDQLGLLKTIKRLESETICWTKEGLNQFEFFKGSFSYNELKTFPAVPHRMFSAIRGEKFLAAGNDAGYRR